VFCANRIFQTFLVHFYVEKEQRLRQETFGNKPLDWLAIVLFAVLGIVSLQRNNPRGADGLRLVSTSDLAPTVSREGDLAWQTQRNFGFFKSQRQPSQWCFVVSYINYVHSKRQNSL